MAEMVVLRQVERDIRGDPVAGEACLARLVRARGVEAELDPVDLALLRLFACVGEGGAEHGGYGDRACVQSTKDEGVATPGLLNSQYARSKTRDRRDGKEVRVRTVGILTRPTCAGMLGARANRTRWTYNSGCPISNNLLELDWGWLGGVYCGRG